MALVQKVVPADIAPAARTSSAASREAEARRKRARTLAKQQQVAERVAAATT